MRKAVYFFSKSRKAKFSIHKLNKTAALNAGHY